MNNIRSRAEEVIMRNKIKVDDFELRLIIRALAEWRNCLLKEDKLH